MDTTKKITTTTVINTIIKQLAKDFNLKSLLSFSSKLEKLITSHSDYVAPNELTSKELATNTIDILTSELSFKDLQKFRTELSEEMRDHSDYVAPSKPKEHLIYKKSAIETALAKIYGLNGAFNALTELIEDGDIILSKCTSMTIKTNQYEFVSTGLMQCKHFMSNQMRDQKTFTPQNILDTFIKASTMLATNYSKHVATF